MSLYPLYTKIMDSRELDFTQRASQVGISPPIRIIEPYNEPYPDSYFYWMYRKILPPGKTGMSVKKMTKIGKATIEAPARFAVSMDQYPLMLSEVYESPRLHEYLETARQQLRRLHDLSIIHGDFHHNNIVLDEESGDVRIIDFGESFNTREMDETAILKLIGEYHYVAKLMGPISLTIEYVEAIEFASLEFIETSSPSELVRYDSDDEQYANKEELL